MSIIHNMQFSIIRSTKRCTMPSIDTQFSQPSDSLTALLVKKELLSVCREEQHQTEIHNDLNHDSSQYDGKRGGISRRMQRRNAVDLVNHPPFSLQEKEQQQQEDCDHAKLLINNTIMLKLRIKMKKVLCL